VSIPEGCSAIDRASCAVSVQRQKLNPLEQSSTESG
jgi:hypothetical protein